MLNTIWNSIWGSYLCTVPTSGFRFQTVRVANLMDPYARIGVKPIAWNRFYYTITYSIVQARQTLPTTTRSFPPWPQKKNADRRVDDLPKCKIAERNPLLSFISSASVLCMRFIMEVPRLKAAVGPNRLSVLERVDYVIIWPIFDLTNGIVKSMASTWNYLKGGFSGLVIWGQKSSLKRNICHK